jgi:uncharacterized membrane protein YfcA
VLDGPWELALALLAAFCVGVSKAGFSGTSLLGVAIFTHLYGAKAQAGMALPLLILADIIVYPAFRKYGSWKDVWRLLPAALVGLAIGWWLLGNVSELVARRTIGVAILLMLALQGLRALKPRLLEKIADHHAFGGHLIDQWPRLEGWLDRKQRFGEQMIAHGGQLFRFPMDGHPRQRAAVHHIE